MVAGTPDAPLSRRNDADHRKQIANRANASLKKDGSEPMAGDLDMGGHNILSAGNLGTASAANTGTSGATLGFLNATKTDTGANIYSGLGSFFNQVNGPAIVVLDDNAFTTMTMTASATGILILPSNVSTAGAAVVAFRVTNSLTCVLMASSGSVAVTTGALTGTTGVDGNLTISVHTDGKIYIENRTGSSRTYRPFFIMNGGSYTSIP